MHRSSSRRSPPGREPPRSSRVGGVVLESVTTMVNGREVDTKIYTAPPSSRTAASRLPPPIAPTPTIVRVLPSSRQQSPPRTSSRTGGHSRQPSSSKTTVYTYPDRSITRAAPLSEKHHSRRPSVDPVLRNPYPVERRAREDSRTRAPLVEDAYSYTDPRTMYGETEPKSRSTRRGSVDASSSRRPMSMYESFPPAAGRATREHGPPPTTRGLDKVNSGGGITRHGSLRDPRTRSPPNHAQRDAYASDDDRYAPPSRSSTAPKESRAYDRGLAPRDSYDDRKTTRRPSPGDEQIPDRGVSGRGFGLMPGASDYSGYSRVEAPIRAPPLAGYLEAPDAVKDLRDYIPDVDRGDRDYDIQERPRKPSRREHERDYDDQRGYDRREKRKDINDTRNGYEDDARFRETEKRRERGEERLHEDDDRAYRVKDKRGGGSEDDDRAYKGKDRRGGREDSRYDDRYEEDREPRHRHRDELTTGAEAALGVGAAAYAANAIGKERGTREQENARDQPQRRDVVREKERDGEWPRERARDFNEAPPDSHERDYEPKGKERERDQEPAQRSREARSPPEAAEREISQDAAGSPDQPRRRRYVSGGETTNALHDEPAATIDPDEDYRRRMEREAQRASKAPSPALIPQEHDRQDQSRQSPREAPSPEDPRQRYIPPDARPPIDDPVDSLILTRANPPASSSNPIYTDPHSDASQAVPPDPDRGNNKVRILEPTKSILRKPRERFPEPPVTEREGVAPLDKEKVKVTGAPPDARWTKVSRDVVNPEALDRAGERYEERADCVIVLRVLSKEEIQKLATLTKRIRDERYEERQRAKEKVREAKQIEWQAE